MTLSDFAILSQIAGTVIVAITLIVLTLEVRQGAEQLRSGSRQTQLENDQTGIYKFVEFPQLGQLFAQKEKPTLEEKTRLLFWIIGQMRAREYEWIQHRNGAMTRESFEAYRGVIFFILGTVRGRELWGLCRGYFHPGFVAEVDVMTTKAPPMDLWARLQEVK